MLNLPKDVGVRTCGSAAGHAHTPEHDVNADADELAGGMIGTCHGGGLAKKEE